MVGHVADDFAAIAAAMKVKPFADELTISGLVDLLEPGTEGVLFVRYPESYTMRTLDSIQRIMLQTIRKTCPSLQIILLPETIDLQLLTHDQLKDIRIC
jgi:hypothetical protein